MENTSDKTENNNNINSDESDGTSALGPKPSSRSRLLPLAVLATAEFLGGATLSILAPFYSEEAENHGLTVSDAGTVFSSVFVIQILFVPLFGRLLTRIGSSRLFISGVLLAGITNVAFGFVPAIKEGHAFLAASLVLRGVTAVGEAGLNVAVLPLARRLAGPGRGASAIGWMETMNGLGTTLGPFLGGVLFEYGGFRVPFVVSGGLLLVCGLVAGLVLGPSGKAKETEEEEEGEEGEAAVLEPSFCSLLRSCPVLLAVAATVTTGVAQQWYQPSLEPYVRQQFGLGTFEASLLFIVDGAVYAAASPVVGLLLDRRVLPARAALLLGAAVTGLGFTLLGPCWPLQLRPSLPQVCCGAALHGLGMSASFIGSLTLLSEEADRKGAASERLTGLVSALWLTCENLGGFLGAAAGAAAYDRLGWGRSCLLVAAMNILGCGLVFLVACGGRCFRSCRRPIRRGEKAALVGRRKPGYGACEENNNCVDVENPCRGPSAPCVCLLSLVYCPWK